MALLVKKIQKGKIATDNPFSLKETKPCVNYLISAIARFFL